MHHSSHKPRSQNTLLTLVNFSGLDIVQTTVSNVNEYDWDGDYRPDNNFTGPLANGDSRSVRGEINFDANGVNFDVKLEFSNHGTISFHVDQDDAKEKFSRVVSSTNASAQCADLEVYQITGTDGKKIPSNSFYVRPKTKPDHSRWMEDLLLRKPNVKLNQLTMPGSHDAGMYVDNSSNVHNHSAESGGGEWAITQKLSFLEQLQAGVRYFDLRVYNDLDDEQWAFHGQYKVGTFYGAFGGKFTDILGDVAAFMKNKGKNEAVFLHIVTYVGHENLQHTADLIDNALKPFLYVPDATKQPPRHLFADTLLSDLKGKVVVIVTSRFQSVLKPGFFLGHDAAIVRNNKITLCSNGVLKQPIVFDLYADSNSANKVKKDQADKLSRYGGYGQYYLFLFSWTVTGSTNGVLDLDLLSGRINAELPHTLKQMVGHKLPNIVHLDQVDPYLCGAIIALN